MPAVRLPRVAEIPEARIEPVFPPALPQQLEKPLFEAPRDDPRRTTRFIVAGSEDRIAASGQTIRQVDADRSAGSGLPSSNQLSGCTSMPGTRANGIIGPIAVIGWMNGPPPNSPFESLSHA